MYGLRASTRDNDLIGRETPWKVAVPEVAIYPVSRVATDLFLFVPNTARRHCWFFRGRVWALDTTPVVL